MLYAVNAHAKPKNRRTDEMPPIGFVPGAKLPHLIPINSDLPSSSSTSPSRPLRKRNRTSANDDQRSREDLFLSEDEDTPNSKKRRKPEEVPMIAIRPPPLAFPKSLYHGYQPSLPQSSEKSILQAIIVGGDKGSVFSTNKLNSRAG